MYLPQLERMQKGVHGVWRPARSVHPQSGVDESKRVSDKLRVRSCQKRRMVSGNVRKCQGLPRSNRVDFAGRGDLSRSLFLFSSINAECFTTEIWVVWRGLKSLASLPEAVGEITPKLVKVLLVFAER